MTRFTEKSFSVVQSGKVDHRRTCAEYGHWPVQGKHGLECWYCHAPCKSDGTDREPTP